LKRARGPGRVLGQAKHVSSDHGLEFVVKEPAARAR
jgi:hypothetical protein